MFKYLSLDLRSLGLFRIGLGGLLLFDLLFRVLIVNDFYTDVSTLPRSPLISDFSNQYFFSFFNIAGKSFYIYFLCFLSGISYLSLALGYKTKLANLFSWLFFVSFSARAPVLSHGGDDLIRLSLLWLFFLPSETHFSIDNSHEKIKKETEILNLSSLAFMLQLIAMYFFTALLKIHPRWMSEGSAIYYSLELDQFLTSFGLLFREFAPLGLLKVMTQITFVVEFLFPFFIFVPYLNAKFRLISILTFVIFHFGLFLVFNLGTFPWICMLYWLAMIPSDFWKKKRVAVIESYFQRFSNLSKPSPLLSFRFYHHASVQALVVVFFSIAMYWNVALHDENDKYQITGIPHKIGSVFRLHQHWNMFAPFPALNDGWVMVEGNLFSGKIWDVFHNKEFTLEKPEKVSAMFSTAQWRKYLSNIATDEYENHRLYFGRYVCRNWNSTRSGSEQVDTFKVYFMLERSRPPGEPKAEIEKQLIWDHYCFSKRN